MKMIVKKKETKSGETEYVLYMNEMILTSQGECHENFVHSVVCLQKT